MRPNQPAIGQLSLALVFLLLGGVSALAQNETKQIPEGKSVKAQGVVLSREPDSFIVLDINNIETVVFLTPSTKVRTHQTGLFRGRTSYPATSILRGLRVQAEGVGNAEGALVAKLVKFTEQDLRTAQALQSVHRQADANSELAKANAELAKSNEERITRSEENQKQMAGQISENTALATRARSVAEAAVQSASVANNRINDLDVFEPVRTFTVNFRSGSAVLLPKAKGEIDAGAEWVKTQNTKGWVVSVVGFADTTGDTEFNRSLSERRAKAVLGYLLTEHNLTLQRLDQPFGYGESKPLAENNTAEGRAKNRRVEIRLLVNKGIKGSI